MNNRVLYITRTDPFINGGGSYAARAYINGFNYLFPGKVDVILADSCRKNLINLPVNFYFVPERNKFSRLISPLTGSLHRFKSYVVNFLARNKDCYNLCIFNGSLVAGDMIDYVNSLGINTITIHHNYEKEYHIDNKSLESFGGILPFHIIRNERRAFINSSINLFLTNQDREKLYKVYGKPQGVSKVTGVFEPENERIIIRSNNGNVNTTFIISGTMSSYQTINGIHEFYKIYFPIVRELCTGAKIVFAGQNPSKSILNMIAKEKDFMQMIPNPKVMFDTVSQGNIYICPISIGGGLKLRVMDGLKSGLPILVHEVSSRGYDCFLNKPWFQLYKDQESFRTGLTILLEWIEQGNWSPAEIQKSYINYFSFKSGLSRLEECTSYLE